MKLGFDVFETDLKVLVFMGPVEGMSDLIHIVYGSENMYG